MKNKTGIRNRKKLWTKIWSGILLFALLFHTGGIGILWESGNSENNGKSIFSRNSIQTVHAEEAAAQQEMLTPEQQAQKEQEAKQKEMNESYAITPETNEVKNLSLIHIWERRRNSKSDVKTRGSTPGLHWKLLI